MLQHTSLQMCFYILVFIYCFCFCSIDSWESTTGSKVYIILSWQSRPLSKKSLKQFTAYQQCIQIRLATFSWACNIIYYFFLSRLSLFPHIYWPYGVSLLFKSFAFSSSLPISGMLHFYLLGVANILSCSSDSGLCYWFCFFAKVTAGYFPCCLT